MRKEPSPCISMCRTFQWNKLGTEMCSRLVVLHPWVVNQIRDRNRLPFHSCETSADAPQPQSHTKFKDSHRRKLASTTSFSSVFEFLATSRVFQSSDSTKTDLLDTRASLTKGMAIIKEIRDSGFQKCVLALFCISFLQQFLLLNHRSL